MTTIGRFFLFPLCAFLFILPAFSGEKRVLRLFTWSSYFSPGVLADFEDAHDCHVAVDTFDSNEAMLDEVVNGDFSYDLITPSSYISETMREAGLIRELDHALIPNARHIDKTFPRAHSSDPEMRFAIPYTRTVTGVGYDRIRHPGLEQSWALFGDPAYARRTTMLSDLRETIGAALKYLGYSLNTTRREELEAAKAVLLRWKGNLLRLEVDESNIGLGAGELAAAQAYNGDIALLMEAMPEIGFFVPREGAAISADDFVILAESANSDLAHAFINHMLDPVNAARNMEEVLYYMPIPEALERIPEKLRRHPAFDIPADRLAVCETIRDVGPALEMYEEVWRAVTE